MTTRIWFALASCRGLDEELAAVAERDAPFAGCGDLLDLRGRQRVGGEPAEGDRGQVDAVGEVDDAARAGGLEPGHPVARQGDLVEERAQPGRAVQRGDRGRARRRVEREEGAAGDALERDRLVLDDAGRVDLEQRAAAARIGRTCWRNVEVRLERRDAPELDVAEAVAGLEHEVRRARGDVAELDDLDRPGRVEREAQLRRAVDDVHLADLERDLAADLEDRLVEEIAEGRSCIPPEMSMKKTRFAGLAGSRRPPASDRSISWKVVGAADAEVAGRGRPTSRATNVTVTPPGAKWPVR